MKELNDLSTLTSKAGKSWENNPKALTPPSFFQYFSPYREHLLHFHLRSYRLGERDDVPCSLWEN